MTEDERLERMLTDVRLGFDRELERDARRFLATLDPSSQDGMWFEAFAESFPSRLAAAIAYLGTPKTGPG